MEQARALARVGFDRLADHEPSCNILPISSTDIVDRVIHGIVPRLHDIGDHRELPLLVLHLILQREILQVEAHLCLLHLLSGLHHRTLAGIPGGVIGERLE